MERIPGVLLEDTFIVSQAPIRPLKQQQDTIKAGFNPNPIQTLSKTSNNFNCMGRIDGIYLWEAQTCTSTFWKCANNISYEYVCPNPLLFNTVNNQCDYKQNIVACGGRAETVQPVQATPQVSSKNVDTDCIYKKDGHYTNQKCSPIYYLCIEGNFFLIEILNFVKFIFYAFYKNFYYIILGQTHQKKCPGDLVFDSLTNDCVFIQDCGVLRPSLPKQDSINQRLYHGGADYYFNLNYKSILTPPTAAYFQTTTQATTKAKIVPGKNCTGKRDGYYYKKACTSSFIICSAGKYNL